MGRWYAHWIEKAKCKDEYLKSFLSESLGMLIFVLISCGTVASAFYTIEPQYPVNATTSTTDELMFDGASILYINFGIAFGYTLGLYVTIENVGYLNPAITAVNLFVNGRKKSEDLLFLVYLLAQFVGALVAALLIWCLYYDKFEDNAACVVFYSSPNGDKWITVLDQLLKSALFTAGFLAIVDRQKKPNETDDETNETDDEHNEINVTEERDDILVKQMTNLFEQQTTKLMKQMAPVHDTNYLRTVAPSKGSEPLVIGLVLFVVGIAFSYWSRFYFNPFQDLAGRIVALLVEDCDSFAPWWTAFIAFGLPMAGAYIAMFAYIFFIENNYRNNQYERATKVRRGPSDPEGDSEASNSDDYSRN